MLLIKPSIEILTPINASEMMKRIERAGRTCYASFDKTCDGSDSKMIKMLIDKGHESVLEHESITAKIITDRGVMAELTRHRHNSFSIQSTRFCDFNKKGLSFIIPPWVSIPEGDYMLTHVLGTDNCDSVWFRSLQLAASSYTDLREMGWKPEQARSVLPNSLTTEIVSSANIRQWRTVFRQRTARATHPQCRQVMIMLYDQLISAGLGIFFEDIVPFRE